MAVELPNPGEIGKPNVPPRAKGPGGESLVHPESPGVPQLPRGPEITNPSQQGVLPAEPDISYPYPLPRQFDDPVASVPDHTQRIGETTLEVPIEDDTDSGVPLLRMEDNTGTPKSTNPEQEYEEYDQPTSLAVALKPAGESTRIPDTMAFHAKEGRFKREYASEIPSRALFTAWQYSAIDQTASARDEAEQRRALWETVVKATDAQSSSQVREAITDYAYLTEFMWFGNDQTPLPRGLKRYLLPDEDAPVMSLDYDTVVGANFDEITELMRHAGMDDILNRRATLFAEQKEHNVSPLVHAVVTNTPGYRLLESFHIDQASLKERPLNLAEKQLEARKAEAAVRHRYGLSETEPLVLHPGAKRDLDRTVFQLDDTTRFDRAHEPTRQSPADKARSYFTSLVEGELGGAVPGNELVKIETFGDTIRISTDTHIALWDPEAFATWAANQEDITVPSIMRLRALSTFVVHDAVLHLFDESNDLDYAAMLDKVAARQEGRLQDDLTYFVANNRPQSGKFINVLTLLTAPIEVDEELDTNIVTIKDIKLDLNEQVLSRKDFRERRKETIGRIKKRTYSDAGIRIIQYSMEADPLPGFHTEDADLVLEMTKLSGGMRPDIPGYEVVGYDQENNVYGFRYTPESDPYAECTTPLPDAARRELAQAYSGIGLNELATLVEGNPDLTVSQLASHISSTNKYILPSESYREVIPRDIEGYADQVEDGCLSKQCVGIANFLRLSLERVYGPQSADVIGGDSLLPQGKRLDRRAHMQTTFIDPETNRTYILDAVPRMRMRDISVLGIGDLLAASVDAVKQSFTEPPEQVRTAPVAVEKPKIEYTEKPILDNETMRRQLLEQNQDTFLMQLRLIYGEGGRPLSEEQLWETVVKLHPDDLVYQSLQSTLRATRSAAGPEEAEKVLRYLEALRACEDETLLRRVDPHQYRNQPRLLLAIENSLSQVTRLTRDPEVQKAAE